MCKSNTSPVAVAEAIVRIKSSIARALIGEDDPSADPQVLNDLNILEESFSSIDTKKLKNFCETIRDPASLPDLNRKIILARGQRYLLSLSILLEDKANISTQENEKKSTTIPFTPFDKTLLDLKGVGPKTAARFASRGLCSPVDVLFWLPKRYDDRRTVTPLSELKAGMRIVTKGTIEKVSVFGRSWRQIMEILIKDGDHYLSAIWFSNKRPRSEKHTKGATILLAGLTAKYKDRLQIVHPIIAIEGEQGDRIGRIVPIYGEIPNVPGATVEKAIKSAVQRADELVNDPLPADIIKKRNLMQLATALRMAHLPPLDVSLKELDAWVNGSSPAHNRLAYDEFFYLQLALALRRQQSDKTPCVSIVPINNLSVQTGKLLGFAPTKAQNRVIDEIATDMAGHSSMRRLLQGDVGSGKTMVALAAIIACVKSGKQAALMAPTEILAEQHMRTLQPVLQKLKIKTALHIGQMRSSIRKKNCAAFEVGTIDLAIGTHALIQESVHFAKLSLVIIDEQHRFGVSQRLGLVNKGPDGSSPHLLVMTATPIPRTLALTVHGDLDVSILDQLPPGRTPINTTFLSDDQKETALESIEQAIKKGEQAYVVCPLIEESEKLNVSSAQNIYKELSVRFGNDKTALLHSKLPSEERDKTMDAFVKGDISVLVATTVIEVGVDVPNASIMMIEGANRFGLAQLHQLRGRVGRGKLASSCFLIGKPLSEKNTTKDGLSRIEVIVNTTDGFKIAEADLEIRGPGELYGKNQAGLPSFKFGNLAKDFNLLNDARQDVQNLFKTKDALKSKKIKQIIDELTRRITAGDGPVGEESG